MGGGGKSVLLWADSLPGEPLDASSTCEAGGCHKLDWHPDPRTLTTRISERKQSWQRLMGGRGFLSLT